MGGITKIIIKETGTNKPAGTITLGGSHHVADVSGLSDVLASLVDSIRPEAGFAAPGTGHSAIDKPIKPGNPLYPEAFAKYLTLILPDYKAIII